MPLDILLLSGKKLTDPAGAAEQAAMVAAKFAAFVAGAGRTLDIAIYDFNLPDPQGQVVAQALEAAVKRGVLVRLAYFAKAAPAASAHSGGDPVGPTKVGALASPGNPVVGINLKDLPPGVKQQPVAGGGHLMHSKYMIRDGDTLWTGSTNFSQAAWSIQDNNIVVVTGAAALATRYQTDFNEMWASGRLAGTGARDQGTVNLGGTAVDLDFAPGDGAAIDAHLAQLIQNATKTIHIASMVISSGPILSALRDALNRGVTLTGVYDGPQMATAAGCWAKTGSADTANRANWAAISPKLAGKPSLPFDPQAPAASGNLMHNKVVVLDLAIVATGSFNFSSNATRNAENLLTIHDAGIAQQYADYIDALPQGW